MGRACAEIKLNEIDLSQLMGNIISTQKVILQPFESYIQNDERAYSGHGISKRVNVLTKPMCVPK